jgi:hypothetical protein
VNTNKEEGTDMSLGQRKESNVYDKKWWEDMEIYIIIRGNQSPWVLYKRKMKMIYYIYIGF